jgi:RNA polymerase-associated protein CTR9
LGQVHLKLGDWKTALANFEKVLDAHPDNCETLKAMGHIFVQQGRTEKALDNFKRATKLNQRDVDVSLPNPAFKGWWVVLLHQLS